MSRADEMYDTANLDQWHNYARELEARVATIEREALERAAKVCDDLLLAGWAADVSTMSADDFNDGCAKCAAAIRALIPCEAGPICLGCTPRNADGSCPDAPPTRDAGPTALRGRITRRDG